MRRRPGGAAAAGGRPLPPSPSCPGLCRLWRPWAGRLPRAGGPPSLTAMLAAPRATAAESASGRRREAAPAGDAHELSGAGQALRRRLPLRRRGPRPGAVRCAARGSRRPRRRARGRDPRHALGPSPQQAPAVGAGRRRGGGQPQRGDPALDGQPHRRPAQGAVRAARQPAGRPLAGRGEGLDRSRGRRCRAAARPVQERAAGDHRPETSDILQSTEALPPSPVTAPKVTDGPTPPWPPPVWLVERTEVFLSTGSVAALGDRPQ